jgi:hypothetical protein
MYVSSYKLKYLVEVDEVELVLVDTVVLLVVLLFEIKNKEMKIIK